MFPSSDDPLSGKQDENEDQTDSLSLVKDALSTPSALDAKKVRYYGRSGWGKHPQAPVQ